MATGWAQLWRWPTTITTASFDLFTGIPGENVFGTTDAGRVALARGGVEPLRTRSQLLQLPLGLDANDTGGSRTANGRFGQTMVACDFNGDGFVDIAIGAPGQDEVFVERNQGELAETVGGEGIIVRPHTRGR